MEMLLNHIPALNSAEIAFNKVADIIGGVKLGRVIYMEGKLSCNLSYKSRD
jgi:hypothetical protein